MTRFGERTDIPFLTTEQMVEVDRVMMTEFHIALIQMMENAGRNLAHLARLRFLDGSPAGKRVVVLAGNGGNGGGALVCARRLWCWGARVDVFVTATAAQFAEVPAHQLDILTRMRVPVHQASAVNGAPDPDLVIDGVIGYGLKQAPHGAAATLIRWGAERRAPTLSLDAPSGVDATTGRVFEPAISATATMTLALPKEGLRAAGAKRYVGELYLSDISVPPELYRRSTIGIDVGPLFAKDEIIRVW